MGFNTRVLIIALLVASIALFHGVVAVNNGLGLTPAMGYNTWVTSKTLKTFFYSSHLLFRTIIDVTLLLKTSWIVLMPLYDKVSSLELLQTFVEKVLFDS